MKKFLLAFMMAAIISPAFAAFQYHEGSFKGASTGSFSFDSNMSITFSVNRSNLNGFGYYNLSNGVKVAGDLQTGKLGNFKSGDAIGIWLQDRAGKTYTSTNTTFGTFARADISRKGDYVIYAGTAPGVTRGSWKYSLTGTETPTPSGQPLPGVLATIILGGAIALRLRNRKTTAK